jgi:hypothetical protein
LIPPGPAGSSWTPDCTPRAGAGGKALGDRFDIADFHEAILVHGRVPLSTLAELVANWITVRRVRAT